MIDEDVRTYLLAQSAVTALVGSSGVYVDRATQGTAAPYVVVNQGGGNPEQHADGATTLHRSTVEVTCHAATAAKAGALANIVETALAAKQVTMGSATVRACIAIDKRRDSEQPQQGDQTGFPAVALSFDVFYR